MWLRLKSRGSEYTDCFIMIFWVLIRLFSDIDIMEHKRVYSDWFWVISDLNIS